MKRLFALIVAGILSISMVLPANATTTLPSFTDDNTTIQDPTPKTDASDTSSDSCDISDSKEVDVAPVNGEVTEILGGEITELPEEISNTQPAASLDDELQTAATVNRITFADWSIPSIRIPDSTTMLSQGVVLNGAITYEVVVRARVYNNGSRYASAPVNWSSTELSSNVKILSPNGRTDYNGFTEVTLHVRNISRLSLKLSCDNAYATKTINFGTKATYVSNFKITQYITARESDKYYTGSKQRVSGLTGTYKSDFIKDVRVQGSGLGEDGRYIKYYNGVFSYKEPTTATGTRPIVGTTIAVDPYYIPCVIKSGTTYKGYVDIQGGIGRRIAEDRGGKITGRHIDVYVGTGRASLKGIDGNYRVLFCGVNSWGTDAVRPASESDELFAFPDFQEGLDSPLNSLEENRVENENHVAFVSNIDYSRANSITITVSDKSTARSISEPVDFDLNRLALSVDDMTLSGDKLIVIGHINPSLDVYQKFDISTKELVAEYYGYNFIEDGEKLFFVQAPQHFAGISGHNRIVDNNGNTFFESGDAVMITNMSLNGSVLSFDEVDINSGEIENRSIDVSCTTVQTLENGYYDFA